MIAHRRKNRKVLYLVLIGGVIGWLGISPLFAANISEFVNIRPYADIEGGYDDNIFGLSEDAPLPEDAESREDSYWAARAGLKTDITLERKFLNLGLGFTYDYTYKKYSNNSDLDDGDHYFDFDFAIASQYESKGFFNDRIKFDIKNLLSYIPIVEERPLLPGQPDMEECV